MNERPGVISNLHFLFHLENQFLLLKDKFIVTSHGDTAERNNTYTQQ